MADQTPQHELDPQRIGAKCPECRESPGAPVGGPGRPAVADRVGDLLCPLCGHDWYESDPRQLAAAWFGWGAYIARREEKERKRGAR